MINYEKLLEFARTDRQKEVLNYLIAGNTSKQAGKHFRVSRQAIEKSVKGVTKLARLQGYDLAMDLTRPAGEGLGLKRSSTYYKDLMTPDGVAYNQWVIFEPGKEEQGQMLVDFCRGLTDELPRSKKTKKPKGKFNKNILTSIVIGDGHFGQMASKLDNLDEDFNIEIATADLRNAIDYLVDVAPPSEESMLVNVGDFLHHDNSKNQTPASGVQLDVSTRHPEALRIAGAMLRYCIDRMAEKFPIVRVVNACGNHDPGSAVALSMFLEGVYEKDTRVIVEPTQSKFFFYEFGKNLIGVTHGDRIPTIRLAGVMTRLAAEQWGRTQWRRWWVGHIHHKQKMALDAGCTVESFNTLAGTDAWHAASGYGGERGIEMITLHREYGEIGRQSPSLEMIRAYGNI